MYVDCLFIRYFCSRNAPEPRYPEESSESHRRNHELVRGIARLYALWQNALHRSAGAGGISMEARRTYRCGEKILSPKLSINQVLLAVPHRVIQDDVYEGYHIPAGATVIPNSWYVHPAKSIGQNPGSHRRPGPLHTIQHTTGGTPPNSTQPGSSMSPKLR
jgi:hypothetical protein